MALLEVLVEVQATSSVLLRGSRTGLVLSDGRSYSDFVVSDVSAVLRLGRFPTIDDPADVYFEADFASVRAFDSQYSLAGRGVVIRVGTGRAASDYQKPSSGTGRGLVWTYHGFIPTNWTPSEDLERGTVRVPVKDPLGYRSWPVLSDHVDEAMFPRAFSPGSPFPILFGAELTPVPGDVCFPMQRIDRRTTPPATGTWALGSLPLASVARAGGQTGTPAPMDGVIASPFDTDGLTGTEDVARARFSAVMQSGRPYSTNRVAWYIGTGIGATQARPVPGIAANGLIETLGDVLWWLLRYRGGQAAGLLHHQTILGSQAPAHVAASVAYYMVERPLEVAQAAEQIGREAFAPLRRVDGARLSSGDTPRWTLADVYLPDDLGWENIAAVDPGWLVAGPDGRPLIQALGAHRLYANSVDLRFGDWPAVTNLASQAYYLSRSDAHAADQAARGVKHLDLAFSWFQNPQIVLALSHGLASNRWGSWTLEGGPPLTYQWAFRLPFGDVLPGDLLHFGPFAADPDTAGRRFVYVVEQTRLDLRGGLLECRGPALWLEESG